MLGETRSKIDACLVNYNWWLPPPKVMSDCATSCVGKLVNDHACTADARQLLRALLMLSRAKRRCMLTSKSCLITRLRAPIEEQRPY